MKIDGKILRKVEDSDLENGTVYLPSIVEEIDDFAFAETKIKRIEFPLHVRKVGDNIFYKCKELIACSFKNDDCDLSKSTNLFNHCYNLKTVVLPGNLTILPRGMFTGCDKLEKVIIPNGVSEIQEFAFCFNASLKTVSVPNRIECITNDMFYGCPNLNIIWRGYKYTYTDLQEYGRF